MPGDIPPRLHFVVLSLKISTRRNLPLPFTGPFSDESSILCPSCMKVWVSFVIVITVGQRAGIAQWYSAGLQARVPVGGEFISLQPRSDRV